MTPLLTKIFSNTTKDIIESGGKIIDNLSTSDEEKLQAKNELSKTVFDALETIQEAQKDIILAETKGNWLQRSWRPIVMLAFAFIVVYSFFLQPAFFPDAVPVASTLPETFWELLKLGLGGYVIGRSAEKIAGNVTRNSDMTLLRKKDRKDIYG